jgi:hypothetical protein
LWLFFLPFIIASCATLSPVDGKPAKPVAAASLEAVIPLWQPFAAGSREGSLAFFAGKTSAPGLEFRALRIGLADPDLCIVVRDGAVAHNGGGASSTKVSSFVRDNRLLAGINALPFDPVSGTEGEPRTNVGIVISGGVMLSPPQPEYDALVFYAEGGAAIVPQAELNVGDGRITEAVGGFLQVLKDGEVSGRALNLKPRHPRSAAGISPDRRFLYLLVIDGRRLGSVGATEAETALLLRALGAHEGINLDGGGSSSLALRFGDGKVRVVNTPIHGSIPGRERAVAGCLGVGLKIQELQNE